MIISCLLLIFHIYISPFGCTLKEDIYQNINDFSPCLYYSGLNGGVGCSSEKNGNYGRLSPINNLHDLNELTKKNPPENIIAYLSEELFTLNSIEILEKYTHIQGIIVKSDPNVKKIGYSPGSQCPNSSPFESDCKGAKWNPTGNNFLYRQFNYPIFLVDNSIEISKIDNCLSKTTTWSSKTYTNCGVHMSSFMFARNQPSTVCLERNENNFMSDYFCNQLSGLSYWASVGDYIKDFKTSTEVIVLSSILDGRSLFYGKNLNAATSLTGLVSLLSVAHILGHWKKHDNIINQMNKNIIIFLNNKETFEFTGSKILSSFLNNTRFPPNKNLKSLSLNNITTFIDFNQLGFFQNNNPLYLHSSSNDLKLKLIDLIQKALMAKGLNVEPSSLNPIDNRELPPSSFVAFHKLNPNIKGVILTDFDTTFKNKRYLSHLDNEKYINITFTKSGNVADKRLISNLENLSIGMAKAVLELTGMPTDMIQKLQPPSELVVQQLFTCIIQNPKCSLFQEVYTSNSITKGPLMRNALADNHLIYKRLLAYFLGTVKPATEKPINCTTEARFDDPNYYSFTANNSCVFDASVYDISTNINYKDPPPHILWTVSEHDPYIFRLYLIPASFAKYITLCIGIVATFVAIGLSVCLTKFYDKKMDLLNTSLRCSR